jgi:hypothetical protein
VFGVWYLIPFPFSCTTGSVKLWLIPRPTDRCSLASSRCSLLSSPSPQQVCLLYCVVERRALQSITCDMPTSRRPILHNNIFYYSTPLCHITTPTEYAGILMRLDLVYFLALFVLPSIARTHQSISHKFMAFGDKVSAINPRQSLGILYRYTERLQGVIDTVIGALQGANRRAEDAANSASNVSAFLHIAAFTL